MRDGRRNMPVLPLLKPDQKLIGLDAWCRLAVGANFHYAGVGDV